MVCPLSFLRQHAKILNFDLPKVKPYIQGFTLPNARAA
jgi:hypothetical protein